jgi:IS5 family transposase
MRQERTVQASIFDLFAGHEIGRELKAMSAWLDDHRELSSLVAADLRRHRVKATGRRGLPAESVLRCALLKQHRPTVIAPRQPRPASPHRRRLQQAHHQPHRIPQQAAVARRKSARGTSSSPEDAPGGCSWTVS